MTLDHLTVIKRGENDDKGHVIWMCRCSCGEVLKVKSEKLSCKRRKSPKSCGCQEIKPDTRKKMEGQTFGRFLVLSVNGSDSAGFLYLCKCSCGAIKTVRGSSLRNGASRSCGCFNREVITSHGFSNTPTYSSWVSARSRCRYEKDSSYPRYGGKGIEICDRWYNSFENFLEDMGERPEGKTLDRIDGERGYYPENCRWATLVEQSSNRKHTHPSLSKYRGVFYKKTNGRWLSSLSGYEETGQIYIGIYDTDVEAALAYDEKVRETGMQAHRKFNFPKHEGEIQAPFREVIQLDDPRHIMTDYKEEGF